jgi:hypothetical protein
LSGRFLWMLTDGITAEIVVEEARRLRLVYQVDLGQRTSDVAPKLGDLSAADALALRAACYARIGVTDPDAFESERLTRSSAYRQWERNLQLFPPAFRRRGTRERAA